MDIKKIHEEIFSYLQKWSEEGRISKELNPYFYMRRQRDERFMKGYWFVGGENYLCISFWEGGDSKNKTPSIYFQARLGSLQESYDMYPVPDSDLCRCRQTPQWQ